ncbi:hypothetical protein HDU97_009046, partial [Phlyctochytrium planicorne]
MASLVDRLVSAVMPSSSTPAGVVDAASSTIPGIPEHDILLWIAVAATVYVLVSIVPSIIKISLTWRRSLSVYTTSATAQESAPLLGNSSSSSSNTSSSTSATGTAHGRRKVITKTIITTTTTSSDGTTSSSVQEESVTSAVDIEGAAAAAAATTTSESHSNNASASSAATSYNIESSLGEWEVLDVDEIQSKPGIHWA